MALRKVLAVVHQANGLTARTRDLHNDTMKRHTTTRHLDLSIRELGQLFNSMDPTPFLNKDLDRDAEAFIENWALGLSPGDRFQITIHLERPYADGDPNEIIANAIHNYFSYKTDLVRAEVKRLLTEGRVSLLIGLVFLTVCLIGAESIGTATSGTTSRVLREGLTIIGWVALWRPLQIFLYDWWPLARRRRIYRNLARALVKVVERPGE